MVPIILQGGGDSPGIYPFDEISAVELGFKRFSPLSEIVFIKYFFLHLFEGICFQYFQVIVGFLCSKPSDYFLI